MAPEALESVLRASAERVSTASGYRIRGTVTGALGPMVEAHLPGARVGDGCRFDGGLEGEVVGFRDGKARILVLGNPVGLGSGTGVMPAGPPTLAIGPALLGRVVDARGRPIDGGPPIPAAGIRAVPLDREAPDPMRRRPIDRPLETGIRAVDGLVPLGHGQRIGLFAGPGVGKSTLLGDLAAGAEVDVVVAALVGERGREVREVLEGPLAGARDRSVVVVAPGDAPPVVRVRATLAATAIAESFRDRGASVLLLVDSLTRYARALREVGLAAGEAPARGGYPPSVFAALPRLIERAGPAEHGEITAVYTVLCEEEDATDAIADEVRGLVDGHLVLSRRLAERGHWPAIDVPASLSRVADRVAAPGRRAQATVLRRRIAAYEERRDLVVLGAYQGGDADADAAVASWPRIEAFLQQAPGEHAPLEMTGSALTALVGSAP
jgi:ATP synthase in type III secretion protein N